MSQEGDNQHTPVTSQDEIPSVQNLNTRRLSSALVHGYVRHGGRQVCETSEGISSSETNKLLDGANTGTDPQKSTAELLMLLTIHDKLQVNQKISMSEIVTGFEMNNKYSVMTSKGEVLYNLREVSGFLGREFYGALRAFNFNLLDREGAEVVKFSSTRGYSCCWVPTEKRTMKVNGAKGEVLGYVFEEDRVFNTKYLIKTPVGVVEYIAEGLRCQCCIATLAVRHVNGGSPVAFITKRLSVKEVLCCCCCSDAQNFGIKFVDDGLDYRVRALILGAMLIFDFTYYEG